MTKPSRGLANLTLTLTGGRSPEQNGEMAVRGKVGNEPSINEIRKGGSDGPREVRVGAR
jgi:hypothetical protein